VNVPAPAPVSTTNNNTAPSGSGQAAPIIVTVPSSPQQLPAPAQTPVTPSIVTIVRHDKAKPKVHRRRHHRHHRRHHGR
jgi:hypothetical protein